MREHDVLIDVFEDFQAVAMSSIESGGTAGVRARVRQRRRQRRITLAGTLAAVLVIAPALGYAARHVDRHAPPVPAATTEPPKVGPDEIWMTVARWDDPRLANNACQTGQLVPVGAGDAVGGEYRPTYVSDLTGDGLPDVLLWMACGTPAVQLTRVLLMEQDQYGNYNTRTQFADPLGQVRTIFQIEAGTDGSFRLEVGDRLTCCPPATPVRQWREYRWTGTGFVQVGGPTSF